MFKIILSPQASNLVRGNEDTPPSVDEATITYRGEIYDLSQLEIGSEVETEAPFADSIKNNEGVIELTLEYNYSTDTAEASQSMDWNDYTFNLESGTFDCPIKRKT